LASAIRRATEESRKAWGNHESDTGGIAPIVDKLVGYEEEIKGQLD
jgi:hypothetical protein